MFYLAMAIMFTVSLWMFFPPNYTFTFIKVIRIENQQQTTTEITTTTTTDIDDLIKPEERPPTLDGILQSVNDVFHEIETGDDN